jgi:endonuclease/exonuclease/phosphatase (EEP) superfamily protein YafD
MAVHPCNPYCGHGLWASEHAALASVAAADLGQPLVLAGDFNAVDDHGPMLDLRRLGLRSATDLVGAGWLPTYPANRAFPPLLPIDHVLLDDQLTATSIRRVRVAGTDHLGLLTAIALAR